MTIDRYTKVVLTIIATSLVYLCIVMTPIPGVQAQTAKRPGDPTGPGEMVIVGWRATDPIPVSFQRPVPVVSAETLRVSGSVTTERSSGQADRMVLVGWEENAIRQRPSPVMRSINALSPGFPVQQK